MKRKTEVKKLILKILSNDNFLSAKAITMAMKQYKDNDLGITSKVVGCFCGELVREGLLVKKTFSNGETTYACMNYWFNRTANEVKGEIPFDFPDNIKVEMEILNEDNKLSGRTRIRIHPKAQEIEIKITIFISKNLLSRKNIYQAIRMVMIHEFSHIVRPKNPDSVMKKYFPQVWKVWSKAQDEKALECSFNIKKLRRKEK